jgi:hypothetical protein
MTDHDKAVQLYESAFGKKQMISVREAATFYGCHPVTIKRQFAGDMLQVPGGVRIPKAAIIERVR